MSTPARETMAATQLLILVKGQRGAAKDMQLAICHSGLGSFRAPFTAFAPLPALSQRFMLLERSDKQTNGPQVLQSECFSPLFILRTLMNKRLLDRPGPAAVCSSSYELPEHSLGNYALLKNKFMAVGNQREINTRPF